MTKSLPKAVRRTAIIDSSGEFSGCLYVWKGGGVKSGQQAAFSNLREESPHTPDLHHCAAGAGVQARQEGLDPPAKKEKEATITPARTSAQAN
jgi:hypothetical protein